MTSIAVHAHGDPFDWDGFVESHPKGTLFHTLAWKTAVEKAFGHRPEYLVARDGGAPVAVLPLFRVKTLKGLALVSVPYGVYGGVLSHDDASAQALVEHARELAAREGVKYVEMRTKHPNALGLPTTDLYVNFEKTLPGTPEECLGTIPRKSRAAVRNGRKKFGLRSEFTMDLETLYDMYALNVRRLGSPTIPFKFLVALRESFPERMDILHTVFEGRTVCCVLNFYFRDEVIPYYSGSDPNYFFTQCNNVMYCDLMEAGVRRGYRRFDFGRSRKGTGPYAFKVNMGFEPQTLNYQYVLTGLQEVPKINPSNPRFELPRRIWSHLPLGLTKMLGPQLLRYIP